MCHLFRKWKYWWRKTVFKYYVSMFGPWNKMFTHIIQILTQLKKAFKMMKNLKLRNPLKGEGWWTEKNCTRQEYYKTRWSAQIFSYFTVLINWKFNCDSSVLSSRQQFWELISADMGIDFSRYGNLLCLIKELISAEIGITCRKYWVRFVKRKQKADQL